MLIGSRSTKSVNVFASAYTLDHRVFLAGDAVHTHSPKAGQGMNISMLDMHNLCWKINLVEKGMADAATILPTYELERRDIAQQLIRFDAEYSRIFSGRSPDATQLTDDPLLAGKHKGAAVDAQKFIEVFKKNARFTSGVGAVYAKQSALNAVEQSKAVKGLKLTIGERLTPGKLTRAMDANVVRLQQEVRMNGAFRIHVFAGELGKTSQQLEAFGKHLDSPNSFFNKYRPAQGVSSSIVDGFYVASNHLEDATKKTHEYNPFFTLLTIIATNYYEWEMDQLPSPFNHYRSQMYGDNIFDKRVMEAGTNAPVHKKYGIDTSIGAIVVVRPDGYVGLAVNMNSEGIQTLEQYFAGFLKAPTGASVGSSKL